MADNFLGEIRIVPFNFPPKGWATCNGQLLPISQNTALFSLLGTQFGGDGRSNFALPNIAGSVPLGFGNGAGLTPRVIGEQGGLASVTLLQSEIAQHSHVMNADSDTGTSTSPAGNLLAVPAVPPRSPNFLYSSSAASTAMLAGAVLPSGGGGAHNNMQPYLTLNFVIAMTGIFPSR